MSFYSMFFGQNPQADLLLAVIGFKKVDVERFRDVHVEDDGKTIAVYTRTGGNNRADYPQVALYRSPLFVSTEDDDFDNTYATFRFKVPEEFVADVSTLGNILENGLRQEFGQHLLKTLAREQTDADREQEANDKEAAQLAHTAHFKANGHTFVPLDDSAMEAALKLAEANGGKLRSCWGILPLEIKVIRDEKPWPNARDPKEAAKIVRAKLDYGFPWRIDEIYWAHAKELFGSLYPVTIKKIEEEVRRYRERAA